MSQVQCSRLGEGILGCDSRSGSPESVLLIFLRSVKYILWILVYLGIGKYTEWYMKSIDQYVVAAGPTPGSL